MDTAVLNSFGGNLAAMALAGTLYFAFRILKRSQCHSHNQCCDFDIAKAETQRDDRIFLRIIEILKKEDGPGAFPLDHARPGKGAAGDEGAGV